MRLATFKIRSGANTTIGACLDDNYVDLCELSGGALPDSMIEFLNRGDEAMNTARELLQRTAGELASYPGPARSSTPHVILIPISPS